jgi:nucleotide-binding universal stress UspA family protein
MKLLEQQAVAGISIKNVLFATDFSEASTAALPYALAVAGRYGSTLHMAHVVPDTNFVMMTGGIDPISIGTIYDRAHTNAQELMQRLEQRTQQVPTRTYVAHGPVWDMLSGIVSDTQADLLVIGTHGRTGVQKLLMGSVAEEIFRQARCPVLTVGPNLARCYSTEGEADFPCAKLELKRVLYATDFATSSLIAASIAMSFAREFQAHLVMLHVMREYIDLHKKPGPIEKTLRRLEEMIPETSGLWFEPEAVVKFGDPSYEILDVAREQKADLIVLGVRPAKDHPSASAHSPWATAHQVIAGARCPVLTVRG